MLLEIKKRFNYDAIVIENAFSESNINSEKLKVFEVPLPPIEEQARIVARVDELMAKIDEYEKIEKEFTELQKTFPGNMKDAILRAAMQGKLTEQLSSDTDILNYYERVLSEEKIVSKKEREISFTGEEPFDIPSNWMWVQLNDLVGIEIRRGKSPKYAKDGKAMAFAQKCKAYSINPISFPEYNGSRCEKRQIPALQGNQKTKKEE